MNDDLLLDSFLSKIFQMSVICPRISIRSKGRVMALLTYVNKYSKGNVCIFRNFFLSTIAKEARAFCFVCASQKESVAPSPERVTS